MSDAVPERDGARITISPETVAALGSIGIFAGTGGRLRIKDRHYTPVRAVAAGFKGVVWEVQDEYGKPYAAKFTVAEDYEDRSFHGEMERRGRLPQPLFPRCVDAAVWRTPSLPDQRFVVTVEDWVQGMTLKEFLAQGHGVTAESLLNYTQAMCGALAALESAELAHDDLHDRNVMLRRSGPGEGFAYGQSDDTRLQVVVVDTGSLKRREDVVKDVDDVRNLASHLVEFHNVLRRRRELTLSDRRFLREVVQLVQRMTEQDRARAVRSGEAIHAQITEAHTGAQQPLTRPPRMNTPFEFISAEQISSDELLLRLFAKAPWLDEVASPDPCLLTGPRGCGKSMLFRYLALRTHLGRSGSVDLDRLRVVGFYISCTSDLQNRFGWIRTKEQAAEHEREIIHYFNLLLTREVLQTLVLVSRREDAVPVYGLGATQQQAVTDFIAKHVPGTATPLVGSAPLRQALGRVEAEMFRSHRRMLRGERPQEPTPTSYLGDLTRLLVEQMPAFDQHRIAFLLDDFSTHRVPEEVQRVLGPIVWERRPSHVFKVSSEKYGTVLDYQGGGTADLTRERLEVDCGKAYVDMSDGETVRRDRAFAVELLRNRLREAGWTGSPEQLIGVSPPYAQLVQELRSKGHGPAHYHGLDTVADLCSGDLSTLLLIYRRILRSTHRSSTVTVTPKAQNAAIVAVSRDLLNAIAPHRPFGRRMHQFAVAYGDFVARALRDGREQADGRGGTRPIEVPRIEVDDGGEADALLTEVDRHFMQELLRRAVFIELDVGRSRHRNVTSLRWQFRRIYMPAFRGPLRKNDAVKLTPTQFEWLLANPSEALAVQWHLRAPRSPAYGAHDDVAANDPLPFGD